MSGVQLLQSLHSIKKRAVGNCCSDFEDRRGTAAPFECFSCIVFRASTPCRMRSTSMKPPPAWHCWPCISPSWGSCGVPALMPLPRSLRSWRLLPLLSLYCFYDGGGGDGFFFFFSSESEKHVVSLPCSNVIAMPCNSSDVRWNHRICLCVCLPVPCIHVLKSFVWMIHFVLRGQSE